MNNPRRTNLVVFVAALLIGAAITWMDTRPKWDDAGITAGSIFIATIILGALRPQQVWLSALAVGAWIPLVEITRTGNYGACLALIVAFAGAYLGAFGRKLLGRTQSTTPHAGQ
jgi:hypothetical protein